MMSKERELLKELITRDMVEYYYPTLVKKVEELLAQPEHIPDIRNMVEIAPSSTKLQDRIKDYLSMGGLFNPELVNHDIVRDLMLDARAELLTQKREPLSDERLKTIAVEDEFLLYCNEDDFIEIARAIEEAHGITGGGK